MAVSAQVVWSDAISRAGSDEELATLVRAHARLVYRVAYSVLRHPEDAEDAVQEVFLRAWQQRKPLEQLRDPRAWLARIAWRVAVDRRRHALEVPLPEPPDALPGIASDTEPNDVALLHRLMASLPAELREPLQLSALQELSAAEVGDILGIPEGTVRNRVFRARRQLKQKVAALMENRHA